MLKIILGAIFSLLLVSTFGQVKLTVTGIEEEEGHLRIGIFENQGQFDEEKAAKSIVVDKTGIKDGSKTIEINIEPGTYGISILDDADDSKNMTYRFGIYPLEGVAFSNFKFTGMSKPKFDDFKFSLGSSPIEITAPMRYF